jgi:uncharacterized membrane protein YphA (DoxX/SURF4 family)
VLAFAQPGEQQLIFPALGGLYQSIAPYSYAIIRFCAGAIVIYHGYMKLFGGFAGGRSRRMF